MLWRTRDSKAQDGFDYELIKHEPKIHKWDPPPSFARPLNEIRHSRGQVIFVAIGPFGFNVRGKVRVARFFPPFIETLRREGIHCSFVDSKTALIKALQFKENVVVLMYNEEYVEPRPFSSDIEAELPPLIFNSAHSGRIISNKIRTNVALRDANVPVPRMAGSGSGMGVIFSNEVAGSKAEVRLLNDGDVLDSCRYNTEYIDTKICFGGRSYFTSIRALCVGGELVHAFVRARDETEGSPSVHAMDTPHDATLIEYLQDHLVSSRLEEIQALCKRISSALGPGFYAHDILISSITGKLYVCEVGFKFEDKAYVKHLKAISEQLPSHNFMFSSHFAEKSAALFLKECESRCLFGS